MSSATACRGCNPVHERPVVCESAMGGTGAATVITRQKHQRLRIDSNRLRAACLILLALALAACAPSRPPGSETGSPAGVPSERVRAPAAGTDGSALQVYRLRNSAVVALGRQAQDAEQAGDLDRAGMLLERALRIDGRDAEILQQLAEVHLARGDLEQAGAFAERARELGPGVGELCERSLRTLMMVHERDGQYDRAWQAYSDLADCRVAPPARF